MSVIVSAEKAIQKKNEEPKPKKEPKETKEKK